MSSARSATARSGSARTGTTRTGTGRSGPTRGGSSRSASGGGQWPRTAGPASGGFDRRPLFIVAVAATLLCGLFAIVSNGDPSVDQVEAAAAGVADTAVVVAPLPAGSTPEAAAIQPAAEVVTPASVVPAGEVQDLDGSDLTAKDSCLMDVLSVRLGATGQSVVCVQQALKDAGFYAGDANGNFDDATYAAARAMQAERDLYVDGVIGRESALSLGVWPDEESFVTRTPPPAAGAVDLMGYPLSSVASAGSNAPALPAESGSGRRLVYDRAGQRVWAVDKDGSIIRSWLVSGSKYSNELPGTHEVYSRSDVSTAWNGKAYLPKMVRWLKTDIGAIGFHSIPLHVEDNSPYQTEAELGTRLSGGCQRQAVRDANFLWDFAQVGTPVVVI